MLLKFIVTYKQPLHEIRNMRTPRTTRGNEHRNLHAKPGPISGNIFLYQPILKVFIKLECLPPENQEQVQIKFRSKNIYWQ